MTDAVEIAIIAGVPATLAVIASVLNNMKLGRVETKVDGRLTELLELTRISSKAQGAKEEKDHPS